MVDVATLYKYPGGAAIDPTRQVATNVTATLRDENQAVATTYNTAGVEAAVTTNALGVWPVFYAAIPWGYLDYGGAQPELVLSEGAVRDGIAKVPDMLAAANAAKASAASSADAVQQMIANGGTGTGAATWASVTNKPAVIAAGATQADALAQLGITSLLKVGTASTDAKAGSWKPAVSDVTDMSTLGAQVAKVDSTASLQTIVFPNGVPSGSGGTTTAANISDASTVGRNVLKATDAAAARAAIGAVQVGTTATDAKAGNWTPTAADISDASATGRSVLKGDAAAGRTALDVPATAAVTALSVQQASDGTWPARPNSLATVTVFWFGYEGRSDQPSAMLARDMYVSGVDDTSTSTGSGGASVAQVVGTLDGQSLSWGPNWTVAGDSITVGSGSSNAGTTAYAALLPSIVGGQYVQSVTRVASAGQPSSWLLSQMDTIVAGAPGAVFVLIGTNDTVFSTWRDNIIAIKAKLDAAGIPVIFGTIPPRGNTDKRALIAAQNLWLRTVFVPNYGARIAEVFSSVVDRTTGQYASGMDSGDGVHPSDAGHKAIATAVGAAIKAAMKPVPWPVTSAGMGKLSDPLTAGSTAGGWDYWAGPAFPARTVVANDGALPVAAASWARWKFASGDASSTIGVDGGTVTQGDKLLVAICVRASDANTIDKVSIANSDSLAILSVLLDNPATATPGYLIVPYTVPANVPKVGLRISFRNRSNQTDYVDVGAADIFNLTTLGLA